MDAITAGPILEMFILIVFLVVTKVVFSAGETSLLSISRVVLRRKAERTGLVGKAFKVWNDRPNQILTTIVIGNNLLDVVSSMLAAYIAMDLSRNMGWSPVSTGVAAAVAVSTATILFGEVIPKIIGRMHAERMSTWFIIPIWIVDFIFYPVTSILGMLTRRFVPKGVDVSTAQNVEEEIKLHLEMGIKDGFIEVEEGRMIHSIFRFSDKRVREVMVHRTDVTAVELSSDLETLAEKALQSGYSRLPVYKSDLDHIVGILYARDILSIWRHRELIVVQDILRKPFFIPVTMRVDRLLHEFKRGKMQMAVVVDEYGGTAGIVTLEDLVEEIIGDIREEKGGGEEDGPAVRQTDGSYMVDPSVSLEELNNLLGLHLAGRGEVASLGGYILDRLGRLPKKGRILDDVEVVLHVLEVDERSILKVRLVKREKPLELKPPPERRTRRKKEKNADSEGTAPASDGDRLD
jgi:putative hemolysin